MCTKLSAFFFSLLVGFSSLHCMQQQFQATATAISGTSTTVAPGQIAGVASSFNEDYIIPRLHNPHNNCFIHVVLQLLLNCSQVSEAFFKPENQERINRHPMLAAYRDFARHVSLNRDQSAEYPRASLEALITIIRQQQGLARSEQGDIEELFRCFQEAVCEVGMINPRTFTCVLRSLERNALSHVHTVACTQNDEEYAGAIAQDIIRQETMEAFLRNSLVGVQEIPQDFLVVSVPRVGGYDPVTCQMMRNKFELTDIQDFYDMGILHTAHAGIDFNGYVYELVSSGIQVDRVDGAGHHYGHCIAYIKKNGKWIRFDDNPRSCKIADQVVRVRWEEVRDAISKNSQILVFKKQIDSFYTPASRDATIRMAPASAAAPSLPADRPATAAQCAAEATGTSHLPVALPVAVPTNASTLPGLQIPEIPADTPAPAIPVVQIPQMPAVSGEAPEFVATNEPVVAVSPYASAESASDRSIDNPAAVPASEDRAVDPAEHIVEPAGLSGLSVVNAAQIAVAETAIHTVATMIPAQQVENSLNNAMIRPARVATHKLFRSHNCSIAAVLLVGSAYIGWQICRGNITHKHLIGLLTGTGSMAIIFGKLCWNKTH